MAIDITQLTTVYPEWFALDGLYPNAAEAKLIPKREVSDRLAFDNTRFLETLSNKKYPSTMLKKRRTNRRLLKISNIAIGLSENKIQFVNQYCTEHLKRIPQGTVSIPFSGKI